MNYKVMELGSARTIGYLTLDDDEVEYDQRICFRSLLYVVIDGQRVPFSLGDHNRKTPDRWLWCRPFDIDIIKKHATFWPHPGVYRKWCSPGFHEAGQRQVAAAE